MNLLDILTTSTHYSKGKCVGETNENLNFDLRVKLFDAEQRKSIEDL